MEHRKYPIDPFTKEDTEVRAVKAKKELIETMRSALEAKGCVFPETDINEEGSTDGEV